MEYTNNAFELVQAMAQKHTIQHGKHCTLLI